MDRLSASAAHKERGVLASCGNFRVLLTALLFGGLVREASTAHITSGGYVVGRVLDNPPRVVRRQSLRRPLYRPKNIEIISYPNGLPEQNMWYHLSQNAYRNRMDPNHYVLGNSMGASSPDPQTQEATRNIERVMRSAKEKSGRQFYCDLVAEFTQKDGKSKDRKPMKEFTVDTLHETRYDEHLSAETHGEQFKGLMVSEDWQRNLMKKVDLTKHFSGYVACAKPVMGYDSDNLPGVVEAHDVSDLVLKLVKGKIVIQVWGVTPTGCLSTGWAEFRIVFDKETAEKLKQILDTARAQDIQEKMQALQQANQQAAQKAAADVAKHVATMAAQQQLAAQHQLYQQQQTTAQLLALQQQQQLQGGVALAA